MTVCFVLFNLWVLGRLGFIVFFVTTNTEIVEDIQEEASKYGTIQDLKIPRPVPGQEVPGVGKVKMKFSALRKLVNDSAIYRHLIFQSSNADLRPIQQ